MVRLTPTRWRETRDRFLPDAFVSVFPPLKYSISVVLKRVKSRVGKTALFDSVCSTGVDAVWRVLLVMIELVRPKCEACRVDPL